MGLPSIGVAAEEVVFAAASRGRGERCGADAGGGRKVPAARRASAAPAGAEAGCGTGWFAVGRSIELRLG
jgi:hypothetical protein